MKYTILEEMVALTPAGWVPDPRYTGGNLPPRQLLISRHFWVSLDRPSTIEEYEERLRMPNTFEFRGFGA